MIIRAATPEDSAAIAQLLDELNRDEGYAQVTDAANVQAALFGKSREVALHALVAQDDARIIGALLYYGGYDTLSASYGYHLADMVVTYTHRRAGVGKALMRALAHDAQQNNKQWVSLTALSRNAQAQAFYCALGLTKVEVDFFAIGKTALAELVKE